MDSKDGEELCNTGADDETTVRDKKRARRVSFAAEITSIHVFDRDEEYESAPSSENPKLGQSNEVLDFTESDDSKELLQNAYNGEEEDEDDERVPFFRDMDSSSPGSAFGSATSNEEDNFFGPVSASFIRPGGLSDSAASDDNHDITLDSTAFSLHFQSLMQSDSTGNFKTPTSVDLAFEERTPCGNSMPSITERFMVLTGAKKAVHPCSDSGGNSSSVCGSSDMSFIEANSCRYDYGKLSPTLDAILAEGRKNMQYTSVPDKMSISKSSNYLKSDSGFPTSRKVELVELKESEGKELRNIDREDTPAEICNDSNILFEANTALATTPIGESSNDCLFSAGDAILINASAGHQNQTLTEPTQGTPLGNYPPDIGNYTSQLYASPVKGSVSSLSGKRQHIFVDTVVSSKSGQKDTPARKQSNIKNTRYNADIASIKNSISKFNILDISPFKSSLDAGDENFQPVVTSHLLVPTSFTTIVDENIKDSKLGQTSTAEMEKCGVEPPNIIRMPEVSVATEHNEECSYILSSGMLCNDPSELNTAAAPPFQLSGSGNNMQLPSLASNNPIRRALVTTEPHSSAMDITFGIRENKQVASTPSNFFHSPLDKVKQMPALPEPSGILPGALNQQDQYNGLHNMEQTQISAETRANEANVSHSTPLDLGSLHKEKRAPAASPLGVNADGSRNFGTLEKIGDREFVNPTFLKESANVRDYITPLRWRATPNSPLGCSDLLTRTDPAKIGEKISERNPLYESASPLGHKRTATAIRLKKRLVQGEIQGPSRKENQALSESGRVLPYVRKGHSDCHQDHQILQETFSVQDVDSTGRKRRIEEINLMDNYNINEIGRIQKSPKLRLKMEVFAELSGPTEGHLLPSISKLSTWELDILEDMLGRLQKAKKYEKLCTLVQFQKTHDQLDNIHQERVAEAKWMQEMLVYEQAKLQLLRLKQEKLRKKVQLFQSGIQESQNLNLCLKNVQNGARDAQNKDVSLSSLSVDLCKENEVTKRQELGALDEKVKNLSKSVLAFCKIKGKPNPSESIVLVDDYLRKKTRCRLIQKELQLCEVDSLEREDDYHNLVLNYCDFLFQSFRVNRGSVSKIVTLNKLNNVNIMKSFPNINACTAFAFVFDDEAPRNLVNSKSLSVETQITRPLLSNLLDVVEEVQVACIELRNLVQTSFHSPCVGQLELELCFVDFKTGNKMKLILDMTCLNRGVYPSEIHPRISAPRRLVSLSNEIEAAIRDLKAGYSRILRLCTCVSHVVQASSR